MHPRKITPKTTPTDRFHFNLNPNILRTNLPKPRHPPQVRAISPPTSKNNQYQNFQILAHHH
ncbi:hypothetical protein KXX41_006816, partial [Aspergillus fumigatus]